MGVLLSYWRTTWKHEVRKMESFLTGWFLKKIQIPAPHPKPVESKPLGERRSFFFPGLEACLRRGLCPIHILCSRLAQMQAVPCRSHAVSLLPDLPLPMPTLLFPEAFLTPQCEVTVPLLGSHSISHPTFISLSAASAPQTFSSARVETIYLCVCSPAPGPGLSPLEASLLLMPWTGIWIHTFTPK